MANRDKKITIARKQVSSSPVPPKENVETPVQSLNPISNETVILSIVKPTKKKIVKNTAPKNANLVANKLKKSVTKNAAKKGLAINFKAKAKKPAKINQRIARALLRNVKNLDSKKVSSVIRNGVKATPPKNRKPVVKKVTQSTQGEIIDAPPVLEPILPLDENLDSKKQTKKINKKSPIIENEEELPKEESVSEQCLVANADTGKTAKKPRQKKTTQNKFEIVPEVTKSESLEDVMNDLSYLITKSEDVKTEEEFGVPESKTESNQKIKRTITRKSKLELFQKRLVKQENIENILSSNFKMDPEAKNLIDMLDLNVSKIKDCSPVVKNKRRHSIEKFPLSVENSDNSGFVFSSLPRCKSPKVKRTSKIRQSYEVIPMKRGSPYSTRSDSPARILRNGKHRKLKDNLLDGLDSDYKKRRRLCSDYSGSEKSVSKVSGYDSDSSFSDLASLIGNEGADVKDGDIIKKELSLSSDIIKLSSIKRTMSTETAPPDLGQTIDTNSNLFQNVVKVEEKTQLTDKKSPQSIVEDPIKTESVTPEDSIFLPKVTEKEVILDIMKQTFNDIKVDDQEKRTTRSSARRTEKPLEKEEIVCIKSSKFYGTSEENPCKSEVVDNVEDVNMQQEELKDCDTSQVEHVEDRKELISTKNVEEKSLEMPLVDENSKENDVLEEKIVPLVEVENDDDNAKTSDSQNISEPPISEMNEDKTEIVETPENQAIKENILQALGLQSLRAAEEAKQRVKDKSNSRHDYTGTLKTVIKLNRYEKKKSRSSLKMTLQKGTKSNKGREGDHETYTYDDEYLQRNNKEGVGAWRSTSGGQTSDTADGSSEHTSDGDMAGTEGDDACKILVIPEKASSFSIHPGRLCKDECSYCFGKFGLFDTPCHIAQMKSVERQDRILATEKHLTRDSCLCDACYRHVDRKSNTPSYTNKSSKRSSIVAPGPRQNYCHVLGCKTIASNILRRKWIIKMRKNVCQVINIDLDNPGLHSIPICEEHFAALEHLMVCAMCKRRLARNHIHYLGPEVNDLNEALMSEGVPIKLSDKPIVCKLCRYFATLILKSADERPDNSVDFFKDYKRRLLHFNDLEVMDGAAAEEPISVPTKEKHDRDQFTKKKKKLPKNQMTNVVVPSSHFDSQTGDGDKQEKRRVPSSESTSSSNDQSRSESPTEYMVDYNTLVPTIAMDCGSDVETVAAAAAASHKKEPSSLSSRNSQISFKRIPRPESVKEAVEISKNLKFTTPNNNACLMKSVSTSATVQRLGANPSISVRQLFPGEEEMGLHANIEFNNVKERTPEGWEKCISTIQYDLETKQLWQDLQKPYGNLSSFLRHLILLEKYYRNGDLVLSANATSHSINYSESVQNRLRAYDNIPSNPSVLVSVKRSSSGIITTKEPTQTLSHTINAANIPKNTPITLSQITSLSTSTSPSTLTSATLTSTAKQQQQQQQQQHQRNPGLLPGLISIHPGTARPVAPLIKVPQTQKIKIPLTKNWRPNLIPIDPNSSKKQQDNKKTIEYVKVISGGKPYHITLEDYHRICAIKRSCDLKQKRLQEAAKVVVTTQNQGGGGSSSLLKHHAYGRNKNAQQQAVVVTTKAANTMNNNNNNNNKESISTSPSEVVENSLKKLDETVEKLESKLSSSSSDKTKVVVLPKIPKSLTVIPQTVSRKSTSNLAATHQNKHNKNVPAAAKTS